MKKFIAILLSVLMLCAMIPFATVAAAEDVSVELIASVEEVDAGDEFEVEVYLNNLDTTAGLISARVEIGFDSSAFELVTYFDEDEEVWMPPIEVGSKYNASSNKYIMYSPIDEETGAMERCLVKYMRATASATQVRKEDHFFTVTFKVKDDAVSGTYPLTVVDNEGADLLAYGNVPVEYTTIETSIVVNGSEPTPPACEHEYDNDCDVDCNLCGEVREVEHNVVAVEAKDATCTELGNIAYWYCDVCGMAWLDEACTQNTNLMAVKLPMVDHEYFYPCDPVCMNCYEITNPDAAHSLSHVEAKDATCFENGNVEYWTCEYCGGCWDNEAATGMPLNQMMVIVPMAHGELTHVEAKDPTCFENGNIEYWYCEACGMAWLDAEGTLNTNLMAVVLPMAHGEITHVAAKDATCTELGNIEYWYCEACGQAWLDEACTLNTNLMAVKLPMADHTYSGDCDADCNVCGDVREVTLPAAPITFGGNSISENKNGLAFLFTAEVDGISIAEDYKADYSNATVIINGEEHKLVAMGAIMNNKGYAEQTLENVDGTYVLNVKANKVFDGSSYAIRIVNIPDEYLDTDITARSYLTYECGGELITIYGADQIASYNGVLNG